MSSCSLQYLVTQRIPLPSLSHKGRAHLKSSSDFYKQRNDISLRRLKLGLFMGAQVIEQQQRKRSHSLMREGSVSKLNDW